MTTPPTHRRATDDVSTPKIASIVRPLAMLWLAGILFVTVTTLSVILELNGQGSDARQLTATSAPFVIAAFLAAKIDVTTIRSNARHDQVDAVLGVINRNTNGELDRRIHEGSKSAVFEVLAEHGIIPTLTTSSPAVSETTNESAKT